MPHVLIAESVHLPTLTRWCEAHQGTLHHAALKAYTPSDSYQFYYQPDITVSALERSLAQYDALIIRPKEVTANAITHAPHLKLIIRGGAGVNSIALETAKTKKVMVENTPGQNSISTAEYTFGLLYELVGRRQIVFAHVDIMESSEAELLAMQPEPYSGHELYGKTLAVIGLGAIGLHFATRAAAFGLNVLAYSRTKKSEHPGITQTDTLEEALKAADIIALHVPLTDATRGMVNQAFLAKIKPGAMLLNTARPQLIDAKAFEQAVARGVIGGLGMDGDPDLIAPFVRIARNHADVPMLLTHHIADSTEEAQMKITAQCLRQLGAFFEEARVENGVV
jgi:D-3-phosphoglycerate dehydrogenase